MKARRYLGLEFTPMAIHGVALGGRGRSPVLHGAKSVSLDKDASEEAIAQAVREVLTPIANGEERVALSLPYGVGRLFLSETTADLGRSREATEVLKWQMKGQLPGAPDRIRLAWQYLDDNEKGDKRILVSVADREQVERYERICSLAGFAATQIGTSGLNAYNYYRYRLDLDTDYVFIDIRQEGFGFFLFKKSRLLLLRSVTAPYHPGRILSELALTRSRSAQLISDYKTLTFLLSVEPKYADETHDLVKGVFGEVSWNLVPHFDAAQGATLVPPVVEFHRYVAAAGAAELFVE